MDGDESKPTPGSESESNQPDPEGSATGSGGDGSPDGSADSGAGTGTGGNAIDWQARATDWQSRHDRAQAELQKREARIAELEKRTDDGGGENGHQPSPALSPADIEATLDRREALAEMRDRVKREFPNADPRIISRRDWESPDALFLAARGSHDEETTRRETIEKEAYEKLKREMADRGVTLPEDVPPAKPGSEPKGAGPTLDEIAKMTLDEIDAVEAEHGKGYVDELLKKAHQPA